MSILKIARMGHPVLRAKTRALHPSEIRTPKIQQLIDDMFETMKEYQGVGLAAPQVHESQTRPPSLPPSKSPHRWCSATKATKALSTSGMGRGDYHTRAT